MLKGWVFHTDETWYTDTEMILIEDYDEAFAVWKRRCGEDHKTDYFPWPGVEAHEIEIEEGDIIIPAGYTFTDISVEKGLT